MKFYFYFVITLMFSPSCLIAADVFDQSFNNYLDGPVAGFDKSIFTSNGQKIMQIKKGKVLTFFDFSQSSLPRAKTAKIAGSAIASNGDLFFADYKNHAIWKVPYTNGEYHKKEMLLFFQSDKLKQPNDLVILPSGDLLLADHPKKKPNGQKRQGGLWQLNIKNMSLDFFPIGGVLSGIAYFPKKSFVAVSSGSPCFLSLYKFQSGHLEELWRESCTPNWSVDGMEFDKNGFLHVARIEQGRVDVFSPQNGKILESTCLLKSLKCGKKTSKNYKIGLLPTDLTFSLTQNYIITFMGDRTSKEVEQQGFIRVTK